MKGLAKLLRRKRNTPRVETQKDAKEKVLIGPGTDDYSANRLILECRNVLHEISGIPHLCERHAIEVRSDLEIPKPQGCKVLLVCAGSETAKRDQALLPIDD
jgi:hypothetical protein